MIRIAEPYRDLDNGQVGASEQRLPDAAPAGLAQFVKRGALGLELAAQGPARHRERAGDRILVCRAFSGLVEQEVADAIGNRLERPHGAEVAAELLQAVAEIHGRLRGGGIGKGGVHQPRGDRQAIVVPAPDGPLKAHLDAPVRAPFRAFELHGDGPRSIGCVAPDGARDDPERQFGIRAPRPDGFVEDAVVQVDEIALLLQADRGGGLHGPEIGDEAAQRRPQRRRRGHRCADRAEMHEAQRLARAPDRRPVTCREGREPLEAGDERTQRQCPVVFAFPARSPKDRQFDGGQWSRNDPRTVHVRTPPGEGYVRACPDVNLPQRSGPAAAGGGR